MNIQPPGTAPGAKYITTTNPKEVTMSDRDEFGAFLVGFIVGGLTGAVVALLLRTAIR